MRSSSNALHPLRNAEPERAILLLRATSRLLLAARGLYSMLTKYSLQCFLQVFHHQRTQDEPSAAHPIYAHPPVFTALLRLFLSIIEPVSESAEEERAERANKLHFDANGGVDCLAALIESFGSGPRHFLHVEVASLALQLAESILVTREGTSDYTLTLSLLGHLSSRAQCRVLLHMARHPRTEMRLRACALLQAVLLECDPEQYRRMQLEGCKMGCLPACSKVPSWRGHFWRPSAH